MFRTLTVALLFLNSVALAQTGGIDPSLLARAKAGNAAAEFRVGFAYANGNGVSQDFTEAAAWYRKAAAQGNADAQSALGVLYRRGQGVPQDYAQAAMWWRKAAAQGEMFAQAFLGSAYKQGHGVPQDYIQAATWYRKAAEQCEPEAQTDLGLLYAEGKGVPQSYTDAYFWLDIGAAQETGEVQQADLKARDDLAQRLTPEELMKVQERASKWFAVHPPDLSAEDTNSIDKPKGSENLFVLSPAQTSAPPPLHVSTTEDWVKAETDQIRAMVQTIKQCPADVNRSPASTITDGPPYNVTWDVSASHSVRAPYSGYIELTVPSVVRCSAARRQQSPMGCDTVERPDFPLVLRYEYDLSPNALSLSKILVRRDNETEWSNRPNVSNYCWERAAQPTGEMK